MTVNQITVQTPEVKAEHVKGKGTPTAFSALIDCLMENAGSCAAGRMQGHLGLQDGKSADSQAKTGKQQKTDDDAKKGAPDTNILCMGLPVSMLQYIGMCTGTAKDTGMTSLQSAPQAGKAGKTQNGVSGVTDTLTGDCSAAGKKSGLAADNAVLQMVGKQAAKSKEGVSPESGQTLLEQQTVGKTAGPLGTFSLHDAEKAGDLTFAGTDLKNGRATGNGAPQAGKAEVTAETDGKAAAKVPSKSDPNAQNITEEPVQALTSGRSDPLPYGNEIGFPEQIVTDGTEKQTLPEDVSAVRNRRTAGKDDAEAGLKPLDGWSAFTGGANAAQTVSSDPNADKTTSAEKEFAFRFAAGPLAFGQDTSNVQESPRNDSGKVSELKGVGSLDAVHGTRPVTTGHAGKTSKRCAGNVTLQDPEEKLKASSDKSTQGGFSVQNAQDGKQSELSVQDGDQQDTARSIVQKTADAASQALKAGKSTIHFHLSPEKLGGITIHMVSRDGSLFMKMTADVQDTGRMLAGGLSDLNSALQQNGVTVGKTEVLLTNGGNMGFTGGFHSGADTQGGRQAYTQQNFGTAEYAAPFEMPVETTAPVFSKISVLA